MIFEKYFKNIVCIRSDTLYNKSMHLNIIPEKKSGRRFMVFVETYTGEDKKQHSRTVRKIGYVDEFISLYPDPIAHFRQVAKEETQKSKEKSDDNILSFSINKDGIMRFDNESGAYDITMHYGDVFISKVIIIL